MTIFLKNDVNLVLLFYISDSLDSRSCRSAILPQLKQVWLAQKPVLQCKYGETAICRWRYSSNSKRRIARKDRFLIALGVECTLSDGFVEQYLGPRQSTLTYQPVLPKIEAIAYTRKRQAKQPCLDAEGATESDGCSSSVRIDDIHVGPCDQSGSNAHWHCMICQMTVTATATVGLGNGVVSSRVWAKIH